MSKKFGITVKETNKFFKEIYDKADFDEFAKLKETDVYKKFASKLFKVPYNKITKEQRDEAKRKYYLLKYV
jgi:hypothetical protein